MFERVIDDRINMNEMTQPNGDVMRIFFINDRCIDRCYKLFREQNKRKFAFITGI